MSTPALRTGVVMDPIAGINIKKDSTFAMLLEAQRRGHEVLYMEPADLSVREDRPMARMQRLRVTDDPAVEQVAVGELMVLGPGTDFRMDVVVVDRTGRRHERDVIRSRLADPDRVVARGVGGVESHEETGHLARGDDQGAQQCGARAQRCCQRQTQQSGDQFYRRVALLACPTILQNPDLKSSAHVPIL